MFKIKVDYPTHDEEVQIALSTTSGRRPTLKPVLSKQQILDLQRVVRRVLVARPVGDYAVRLVRATRPHDEANPDFVKHYVTWGAGPRACQALLLGAKAHALLDGRTHASIDDVRLVAKPVLRHRLVTNFTAESENVAADQVIDRLLDDIA
jgi:MoxR-like ATPase